MPTWVSAPRSLPTTPSPTPCIAPVTPPEEFNRFARQDDRGRRLVIDVLAPSYVGRLETNQAHGVLVSARGLDEADTAGDLSVRQARLGIGRDGG